MKYTRWLILALAVVSIMIAALLMNFAVAVAMLGTFILGMSFEATRGLPPAFRLEMPGLEALENEWNQDWKQPITDAECRKYFQGDWTPNPKTGWETQPGGDDHVSSLFPPPPRIRRFNSQTGTFDP